MTSAVDGRSGATLAGDLPPRRSTARRIGAPAAAGLVLAASTSVTWLVLDRVSPPPTRPEPAAPAETVDLAHGGAKVVGTVELAFDATTARVALTDVEVPVTAWPPGSGRLVLEDVVVAGARSTLVWSGGGPLNMRGALSLYGGRLIGGSAEVVVDDHTLRIGSGPLRLDGAFARTTPRAGPPSKTTGAAGTKGRAISGQFDRGAIEVIVDERSKVSVTGRLRLGLPEGQLVTVHAPVVARGDLEVSGPQIVEGTYRRIDIASGLVHLQVADAARLVFARPVSGTVQVER